MSEEIISRKQESARQRQPEQLQLFSSLRCWELKTLCGTLLRRVGSPPEILASVSVGGEECREEAVEREKEVCL